MSFPLIETNLKSFADKPKTLDEFFADPGKFELGPDEFKNMLEKEDFLNRSWPGGGNIFHEIVASTRIRCDFLYEVNKAIPRLFARHLELINSVLPVLNLAKVVMPYLYPDAFSLTFQKDSHDLTPVTLVQKRIENRTRNRDNDNSYHDGFDGTRIIAIREIRRQTYKPNIHSEFVNRFASE